MEPSQNNELRKPMLNENVANFFMSFNKLQNETQNINNFEYIDNKAMRMMSKMGYQTGTGLGRNKQGIVEPVEVQSNLGRRGLGHIIENLQPTKETWDFSVEEINIQENMEWLLQGQSSILEWLVKENIFDYWIVIGPKITNKTVLNETKYCDSSLVNEVFKAKEILDGLDPLELCKARSRANAFETLRSAFFMNRAALKMANIDAATNFLFTNIDRQPEHKQSSNPYYFADICAGPGGFSEYIFWRKKWGFKGFGITLRGEHDFKLNLSTCAASETFEAMYGTRDDGDVYFPENINDFSSKVKCSTDGLGVHFVMGDGGFSVENQENLQEVLSRQIYVCQCLIALNILRPNGHFVVKLFDLFTPFSVELVYLMYRCFKKVTILKPNSSRPANSERYLICSYLIDNEETNHIKKYLQVIVQKLFDIRSNPLKEHLDINKIVPDDILMFDYNFIKFIQESNMKLAKKQLLGLQKLAAFIRDPTLFEPKQDELRSKCLEFWQVPDKPRVSITALHQLTVDNLLISTITNTDFMTTFAQTLVDKEEFYDILTEVDNWHFSFSTINDRVNYCNIYAGLGLNYVYRFDPLKQRWNRIKNVELVRGTILFGEIVNEFSEQDENIIKCLHVIDALRLGDTSLADFRYEERLELINIYCKAVNRDSRTDIINIRAKPVLPLSQLKGSILPTLINNKYQTILQPVNCNNWNPYYNVNSILIFKTDASESFDTTISSRCIIQLPNYYAMKNKDKNHEEYQKYYLWKTITNILQSK